MSGSHSDGEGGEEVAHLCIRQSMFRGVLHAQAHPLARTRAAVGVHDRHVFDCGLRRHAESSFSNSVGRVNQSVSQSVASQTASKVRSTAPPPRATSVKKASSAPPSSRRGELLGPNKVANRGNVECTRREGDRQNDGKTERPPEQTQRETRE